jgi:hypothetical protein
MQCAVLDDRYTFCRLTTKHNLKMVTLKVITLKMIRQHCVPISPRMQVVAVAHDWNQPGHPWYQHSMTHAHVSLHDISHQSCVAYTHVYSWQANNCCPQPPLKTPTKPNQTQPAGRLQIDPMSPTSSIHASSFKLTSQPRLCINVVLPTLLLQTSHHTDTDDLCDINLLPTLARCTQPQSPRTLNHTC